MSPMRRDNPGLTLSSSRARTAPAVELALLGFTCFVGRPTALLPRAFGARCASWASDSTSAADVDGDLQGHA